MLVVASPIMDAHTWLEESRARAEDLQRRARSMQTELADLEATSSSRDGAVTVTVNASGRVLRLVLGETSTKLSRVQLAEAILATICRAQGDVGDQTVQAFTKLVGAGSPAVGYLRSQIPPRPQESEW